MLFGEGCEVKRRSHDPRLQPEDLQEYDTSGALPPRRGSHPRQHLTNIEGQTA